MESFTTKALELQRLAHQLLFFEEDASLYSDDFCRQNRTVLTLSDTLYSLWNTAGSLMPEEDAEVCLALLMGYNATIYGDSNKQEHIISPAFSSAGFFKTDIAKGEWKITLNVHSVSCDVDYKITVEGEEK